MSRVWLVALLVTAAACASSARVARLERRLATAEATQAKSDFELRASQTRIEQLLERLAGAAERAAEASTRAAQLEDQLAALERRVATPPAPPPPRPAANRPDPTLTYAVPIGRGPVRGKPTALVTIIWAGEYACPYCEKVRPTIDQLVATYGDKLRVVHRSVIVHPQIATYAARAACAAHRQGKFFALDRELWDQAFANRRFAPAEIDQLAIGVGLAMARFRADVAGPCVAEVEADQAELARFGVNATPSFFINGRYLAGAQPLASFAALVDEELAKAEAAVSRGVKPARYYQQEILGKGLTGLAIAPAHGATP
jgi:protein-disulfide isomerase